MEAIIVFGVLGVLAFGFLSLRDRIRNKGKKRLEVTRNAVEVSGSLSDTPPSMKNNARLLILGILGAFLVLVVIGLILFLIFR